MQSCYYLLSLFCEISNIVTLFNISFQIIMKRIPDSRVKKGCSILTILDDGSSFLYKYPPGSLLSPSSANNKCPITMMENTNSSRTEAGLVATICYDDPSKVVCGTINHEIILCQGVAFQQDLQDIVLVYHKWRKDQEEPLLYDLLSSSVTNASVIAHLFDFEPMTMRLTTCSKYIMYFNQIAGPTHHSFVSSIRLSPHKSGVMIYESSLFPDRWSQNTYYDRLKTKFKFFRFDQNTCYAPDVHVKKRNTRAGCYAGIAKSVVHKSCSVLAVYCIKVNFGNIDGMFLQPVPKSRAKRPSGEYEDFCLLTRTQCSKLDIACKANGRISLRENGHMFVLSRYPSPEGLP